MKLCIFLFATIMSLFGQTEWFYLADTSGSCQVVNEPGCLGVGLAIQPGAAISSVKINGLTLDPSAWVVSPDGQMVIVKIPFQQTDTFSVLYQ